MTFLTKKYHFCNLIFWKFGKIDVKKYIDGISFANVVTYDKKDNTSDNLIKDFAKTLGFDIFESLFGGNFDLLSYINYFIKLQSIKKNTYKCVFVGLHGLNPKLIIKNLNYQKIFQFIRNDLILCDKTNKAHNHIVKYGKIIDYYVCVAGSCKESFDEKYPALMHKSIVIYNLLSAGNIIEKSKEIIDSWFENRIYF